MRKAWPATTFILGQAKREPRQASFLSRDGRGRVRAERGTGWGLSMPNKLSVTLTRSLTRVGLSRPGRGMADRTAESAFLSGC